MKQISIIKFPSANISLLPAELNRSDVKRQSGSVVAADPHLYSH